MKKLSVYILSLLPLLAWAQPQVDSDEGAYSGHFSAQLHEGESATFYTNSLKMNIKPGGAITFTYHIKAGPADDHTANFSFGGTLNGVLENNSFSFDGTTETVMVDGKRTLTGAKQVIITGTLNSDTKPPQVTGTLFLKEISSSSKLAFTFKAVLADASAEGLMLTYPLGKSPKIFDKGWSLGASCMLNQGQDNERDLSENIQWSGTGSFEPATGATTHPVFSSIGKNKIILTVQDGENKLTKEFTVDVVDCSKYAYLGLLSYCPADAHGCPACPHHVIGYILTGDESVNINGHAVACKGDRGVHFACCAGNKFVIAEGDPNVLVNGKQVARIGMRTDHCGGSGIIVTSFGNNSPDYSKQNMDFLNEVLGQNDNMTVTATNGEKRKAGDQLNQGDKISTGAKGMGILKSGNAIISVGPSSELSYNKAGEKASINMEKGTLQYLNAGLSSNETNIKTPQGNFTPVGTQFTLLVTEAGTQLYVVKGKVEADNGKQKVMVEEDNNAMISITGIKVERSTDSLKVEDIWKNIAKNSTAMQMAEMKTILAVEPPGNKNNTWLYLGIGGGILSLLVLVVLFGRRKKKE